MQCAGKHPPNHAGNRRNAQRAPAEIRR